MHLGQPEGSTVVQSLDKLWALFVERVHRDPDSQSLKYHQNRTLDNSDALKLKFIDELERVRKHLLLAEAGLEVKESRSPYQSRSSKKSSLEQAVASPALTSGDPAESATGYRLRYSSPGIRPNKHHTVNSPQKQRLASSDLGELNGPRRMNDVSRPVSKSRPKRSSNEPDEIEQLASQYATIRDYMLKLSSNISKLAAVLISCDQVYTRWRNDIPTASPSQSQQTGNGSNGHGLGGRSTAHSANTPFGALFACFDELARGTAGVAGLVERSDRGASVNGSNGGAVARYATSPAGLRHDGSGDTNSLQTSTVWVSGALTVLRVSLDKCRSLGSEILRESLTRLEVSSYLVSELRAFLSTTKRISERVLEELQALSTRDAPIRSIVPSRQARSVTPRKISLSTPKRKADKLHGKGMMVNSWTQTQSGTAPEKILTISRLPGLKISGRSREEATKAIQNKIALAMQDFLGQWKTTETKLAQLDSRVGLLSDSVLTSTTISNLLLRAREDAQNLRNTVFILEQE